MNGFSVTYEIVTSESAEHGEAAERGFVLEDVSLREAVEAIGGIGALEANVYPLRALMPPRWFTNYKDNEDESRSLHLPRTITPASALRVARLLGMRR